jgi:hypothetical protein
MGGNAASKGLGQKNGNEKSAETINLGIINASSNSFSESVPIWEIIEIVSLVILFLLVVRWIRKWIVKRKAKKTSRQTKQMAMAVSMQPRSTQDMENQPIRQIQRQLASLTEIPNDAIVSAPKLGAYDQYR